MTAALALAEHYFPAVDEDGRSIVRVEDAHVFLEGHIGETWPAWDRALPYEEVQRIGRALGRKWRSMADLGALQHQVRRSFTSVDDSVLRSRFDPGSCDGERMLYVYPRHGQDPLEVAAELLGPLQRGAVVRTASGGGWETAGPRGRIMLGFADAVVAYEAPSIKTADFTGPIALRPALLSFLAKRADHRMPGARFRQTQVDLMLAGTLGHGAAPPTFVPLFPGLMTHVSAPTGYGKNVTTRAQCWQAAREGRTMLVVLPGNDDVFAEAAKVREELAALKIEATVAPLISPRSRRKVALQTAGKTDAGVPLSQMKPAAMAQFREAGYSCALNAQLDTGDRFGDGQEPCTRLRSTDPIEDGAKAVCPFIGSCSKFSLLRAALGAQIIITNHAYLQKGMVKLPIEVDGELRPQMSAAELLLRLCELVFIDEVDAYQARGFESSSTFNLAVTGKQRSNTALHRIDANLYLADSRLRTAVRGQLSRAIFLSEQLLDLAASAQVCTETRQAYELEAGTDPKRVRRLLSDRRRWYMIHKWDRGILENLLGVDPGKSATENQLKQLRALMPPVAVRPPDRVKPDALPVGLRKIPIILERVLTVDESGQWPLDEAKTELKDVIGPIVKAVCIKNGTLYQPPPKKKGKGKAKSSKPAKLPPGQYTPAQITAGVVHNLMMKAWLSAIDVTIFDLADHADALMASGIDAAGDLAEALGHLDVGSVVPYGPLGRQISGYRFEGLDDPAAKPRLRLEVLRGDPHTETARLGDVVSLALAGHRRVVVGLSATGFMPGATRTHLMVWPTYAMPDAQRDGLSIFRSTPVDADGNDLAVGGTPFEQRDARVAALARGYAPDLIAGLNRLAADPATAHRARALIAVNSYRQARLFAQALYEACLAAGRPVRILVAEPDVPDPFLPPVSDAIKLVTRDQFADMERLSGEVLISPLGRTERGLNILAMAPSGKQESAITLIALAVRPVMPIEDASAMAASIAWFAWRNISLLGRPAATLKALRALAEERLKEILAAPLRFTALPDAIQLELIAGVLVQVLQLAGRGRRGQTHVELHFLDGAFHDSTWGSDLPTLTGRLYSSYDPLELAMIGSAYGYSGEELLDYANVPHLRPQLRSGYPAKFGRPTP